MLDNRDHAEIRRHLAAEEAAQKEAEREELAARRRRRTQAILDAIVYAVADAVREGRVTTRMEAAAEVIEHLSSHDELDDDAGYDATALGPIDEHEALRVVRDRCVLPDDHGRIAGTRDASGWHVDILHSQSGEALWRGGGTTLDAALREACARACEDLARRAP